MSKQRAKMGRPPKPPAKKMGRRVYVNMTEAEFRRLKAKAKKNATSISQVLMRPWRPDK